MSALALSNRTGHWGDIWRKDDPQTGLWQTSSKPSQRTSCATLLVHSSKEIVVEPCWYEGNTVRVVARPVFDANILAIDALYADATAGEQTIVAIPAIFEPQPDPLAALRVARLSRIQTGFGTSLQGLAEILRVSRPQLYKWLDASQTVRLQADSTARMLQIEGLAHRWSERSRLPLASSINEPADEGATLLELLSAENLDMGRIHRAFETLAERLRQAPKSPAERMRDAGFTRRQRVLPTNE